MKKYNNTHKILNTVVFGALTLGFLALAFFFAFIWAPSSVINGFISGADSEWANNDRAFALNALVGIGALVMAIISIGGLVTSIKSFGDNTDKGVKNSFLSYIALGYSIAVFFFINAIWLPSMIGGDQITFWVVLSIIGCVIALIASNVPMMKLLEDDDPNIISAILAGVVFAIGVASLIVFVYNGAFVLTTSKAMGYVKYYFIVFPIISIVVAALSGIAMFKFVGNHKKGVNNDKISSLTFGSAAAFGLLPLASGIIEIVLQDISKSTASKKITLMTEGLTYNASFDGDSFIVWSFITGCLIIVLGLTLVVVNLTGKEKKAGKTL